MDARRRDESWRIGKAVLNRSGVANLVGALVAFMTLGTVDGAGREVSADEAWTDVALFVAYLAVAMPLAAWKHYRALRRNLTWFRDGRPPTAAERATTLRAPVTGALRSLAVWGAAALFFGAVNVGMGNGPAHAARVAGMILLSGLVTCAVEFLLVERAMRPVFAAALVGEVPGRAGALGVRARILLSWALGSVVPMVLVGVGVASRRPGQDDALAQVVWVLVGFGIAAGYAVIGGAARSVSDHLHELREAVDRVAEGDLDVEVAVDDGGEVGRLEAGFNRMVGGLRERRRLEDLFGRHVGAEAARYAVEHGAALGGERREVSVLFVDLVGSTALAQTRPPSDVVAMLNSLFDAVVRRVEAEGGWVNKFEGDGALCVFGAPVADPDHAARALRAARLLRGDLLALALTHEGLDAGIGVSSGEVVAGNVGTERRHEYTVIGDPVNEAARLTDAAKRHLGRVLASDESVARAGAESVHWQVADELRLRGRRQPTLAYQPSLAQADVTTDPFSG